MDKKTSNFIKKAIRKISSQHQNAKSIRKRAKQYRRIGTIKSGKNKGRPRYKFIGYLCTECKGIYEKIQVDHIDEVGEFTGDWNKYIDRLFCDISNLQPLCEICHKAKTKEYNQRRGSDEFYL